MMLHRRSGAGRSWPCLTPILFGWETQAASHWLIFIPEPKRRSSGLRPIHRSKDLWQVNCCLYIPGTLRLQVLIVFVSVSTKRLDERFTLLAFHYHYYVEAQ